MKLITSPSPIILGNNKAIFLCGSIEENKAIDWQRVFAHGMKNEDVILLNPRRKNWDPTWEPVIENKEFKQQVLWELNGLDQADLIVVFFDKDTESPITLMEIGLHAKNKSNKMVVCCPDGYFRKGNVDIVCELYNIPQVDTLEELIEYAKKYIK